MERSITLEKRQLVFVGAVAMLVVLCVGVFIVFSQSAQEWGALPSTAGGGMMLYVGTAFAFVVVAGFVIWAWLQLRDTKLSE
jgi:uncharacterized membrane protein